MCSGPISAIEGPGLSGSTTHHHLPIPTAGAGDRRQAGSGAGLAGGPDALTLEQVPDARRAGGAGQTGQGKGHFSLESGVGSSGPVPWLLRHGPLGAAFPDVLQALRGGCLTPEISSSCGPRVLHAPGERRRRKEQAGQTRAVSISSLKEKPGLMTHQPPQDKLLVKCQRTINHARLTLYSPCSSSLALLSRCLLQRVPSSCSCMPSLHLCPPPPSSLSSQS